MLTAIDNYQLVPKKLSVVAACVLPFFELVLGTMLLTRVAVRAALMLSLVLVALFLSVQVTVVARGLTVNCGCYGPVDSVTVGARSIIHVSVLLLLVILAMSCSVVLTLKSRAVELVHTVVEIGGSS